MVASVMPGFNDAHTHLGEAGLQRLTVNLTECSRLPEFRERIKARVKTATPGEWIAGGGWDETLWPVKEVPTRADIDEATGDHPVLLERVDGHAAVANTRALEMAGITSATKDPQGGRIVRDESGWPNGVLRDTAVRMVTPTHPFAFSTCQAPSSPGIGIAGLGAVGCDFGTGLLIAPKFPG